MKIAPMSAQPLQLQIRVVDSPSTTRPDILPSREQVGVPGKFRTVRTYPHFCKPPGQMEHALPRRDVTHFLDINLAPPPL